MKALIHMSQSFILVASLLWVVTCHALCAESEPKPDTQRAEIIKARIVKDLEAWFQKPENARPAYDSAIRDSLGRLSEDEIRIVAQYVHDIQVEEEAFRRWARFDPAAALKAVRVIEDAHAAEIRLAGTGLEGGPGDAMSEWVFGMYFGALDGWSEVAPKVAWELFKKQDGPLSKSLVVEDYLDSFYPVLFDHLAKVDPDLAFQELIQFRAKEFEEMSIASMLAGYLHGAPRGRDWRKEAELLLARKWEQDYVYAEIRTALMGRWLEDDSKAAVKWFSEGDVEDLHWLYVKHPNDNHDPFAADSVSPSNQEAIKEKKRYDLGSAAGYWAARDFSAAWRWMKSYSEFHREDFGRAVMHGVDVYLSNRISYFVEGGGARLYVLEKAALLPDHAERAELALRFAKVLWVFDGTIFLGKPAPDKMKWLASVRESISALRLSNDAVNATIDKLQNKGQDAPSSGE